MDDVESQLGKNFALKRPQIFHFIYFPVELQVNFVLYWDFLLISLPVPLRNYALLSHLFSDLHVRSPKQGEVSSVCSSCWMRLFSARSSWSGRGKSQETDFSCQSPQLVGKVIAIGIFNFTSTAERSKSKDDVYRNENFRYCLLNEGKKRASRTLVLLSFRHVEDNYFSSPSQSDYWLIEVE